METKGTTYITTTAELITDDDYREHLNKFPYYLRADKVLIKSSGAIEKLFEYNYDVCNWIRKPYIKP
jgi:hypothetical protein